MNISRLSNSNLLIVDKYLFQKQGKNKIPEIIQKYNNNFGNFYYEFYAIRKKCSNSIEVRLTDICSKGIKILTTPAIILLSKKTINIHLPIKVLQEFPNSFYWEPIKTENKKIFLLIKRSRQEYEKDRIERLKK